MPRYSWKMVFEDFKNAYPEKWKRGTGFKPLEFMSILIYIPGDGKYKYEYFGKKLTLIEKYLTPKQTRVLKEFERGEEIRNILEKMEEKGVSQTTVSYLSGVSRESINRYKNGRLIPRSSTLEKIKNAVKNFD